VKEEEIMIKMSDVDKKFKCEITRIPGAENVVLCYQCGDCTGDCPVARFSDVYRPRKLIRMVQLGLKKRLLSNEAIWLCSTCFKCVDRCPQGVGAARIVRALRNLTAERGKMPNVYRQLASNILKTGYAYMITGLRLKRREEEGLPPLPKPNLEDLAKVFEATGLSKILEREGT